MIIIEAAYARSGLVGNPSDIFHGKTISLLFDKFKAEVIIYETPHLKIVPNSRDKTEFSSLDDLIKYRNQYGYYGGIRIIEAIIVRFKSYCNDQEICLPKKNFTLEYCSNVPFGVGLGGSSAIIKAVLSALMKFYELSEKEISKPIQSNLILEAETVELDISAGPQDRVVEVYGGLVYMDFTEEAYASNQGLHGIYYNLNAGLLPPLFISYKESLSKSSGKVHNIMRYRAVEKHDQKVIDAMRQKAALAEEAKEALIKGEKDKLGPIMTKDFKLRKSVYTISEENLNMIDIAQQCGAHAKFTGSGGAAIGIYDNEKHFQQLQKAYHAHGYITIKAHPVEYS